MPWIVAHKNIIIGSSIAEAGIRTHENIVTPCCVIIPAKITE